MAAALPENPFLPQRDLYLGPVQPVQPGESGGYGKRPKADQLDNPFGPPPPLETGGVQGGADQSGGYGGGFGPPPRLEPGGGLGGGDQSGGGYSGGFGPPPPLGPPTQSGGEGASLVPGSDQWNWYFNNNPGFAVTDYSRAHGIDPNSVQGRWLAQQQQRLFNDYGAASARNAGLNFRPYLDSQAAELGNWWGVTQAGLYRRPPRGGGF